MPPSDERVVGVVAEEKGGSGIWEGGGVVVRWPAEPMQQEVNGSVMVGYLRGAESFCCPST